MTNTPQALATAALDAALLALAAAAALYDDTREALKGARAHERAADAAAQGAADVYDTAYRLVVASRAAYNNASKEGEA
jgi:hypothetical protein